MVFVYFEKKINQIKKKCLFFVSVSFFFPFLHCVLCCCCLAVLCCVLVLIVCSYWSVSWQEIVEAATPRRSLLSVPAIFGLQMILSFISSALLWLADLSPQHLSYDGTFLSPLSIFLEMAEVVCCEPAIIRSRYWWCMEDE